MQFSATVAFEAADEAAALAEVESWQLTPGTTVHGLMGIAPVAGMPATVTAEGALTMSEPIPVTEIIEPELYEPEPEA